MVGDSTLPPPPLHFDAIVVGSGYGGAVAAYRLAQAGLRVCILEKGRKWEPHDFPTTLWQVLRNVRVQGPFATFGRKDALYQLHFQKSAVAIVAAGLGGGSLINAGVVLPTPMRARKHPRWPEEWEKEWHASEKRARAMLEPESVPHTFPNTRVMNALSNEIEDSIANSVQLSIRFKNTVNIAGVTQNSCTACGNCFTGCPYNAKNSVDKNYLAAAIEAGAMVRTGCEVCYVLPETGRAIHCNSQCATLFAGINKAENHYSKAPTGRRWRVYVNQIDYLSAEYVVLSAGVLGTTKILFESKQRGLALPEKLGCGVSCNGNHVGFVTGARAPTKGYSLKRNQLAGISMAERPGPSITNAYTSSLGFTIQGAVLSEAFSFLLFKCMATCGWRYGLFSGMIHNFKRWMNTVDTESLILNMMGHDLANGQIELHNQNGHMSLTPPYDPLLTKKISTIQKIAKRMDGMLFMSPYSTTTVHLLGGCNAAKDATQGVTNSSGQVFRLCGCIANESNCVCHENKFPQCTPCQSSSLFVHAGLYVCDASLIPCAVGVNPSLTITTVAEHVSKYLVEDALKHYGKPVDIVKSAVCCSFCEGRSCNHKLSPELERETRSTKHDAPTVSAGQDKRITESHAIKVIVEETLSGNLNGMPCTLHVIMHMGSQVEGGDFQRIKSWPSSDSNDLLRGKVGGKMIMPWLDVNMLHVVDGTVDMCYLSPRTPFTQYMHYHLQLASSNGARYVLDAKKEMHPFLLGWFSWQESTTLHVALRQISNPHAAQTSAENSDAEKSVHLIHGTLKVSILGLLQSLFKLRGPKRLQFVLTLAKSIIHTYFCSKPRLRISPDEHLKESHLSCIHEEIHPSPVVHEMQTGDGRRIGIWQWTSRVEKQSNDSDTICKEPVIPRPVLLLNGYSGESFFLPTEGKDLVRTLLCEGYEPWLLRPRLHPTYCATKPFTIDDIANFDIPAAFSKIAEVHGCASSVHVVAHCIGGLAIHMAILGGTVSASSVASLTCTNSSMFFNVTPLAMSKLILPLIPISLRLMGKNTVLSFSSDNEESWRHKLAKSIAKMIPRVERCLCKECELFSGIFGNAFWHENLTEKMHDWLSKMTLIRLPMTGFVQLRKICRAGKVVDCHGEDKYLPFIARLEVPTTYISGGRPLLVTPATTERAHALMLQHHPQFHHRRFVLPGYGHSDLLIGQYAHHDVFPLILDSLKGADHHGRVSTSTSKQTAASWETVSIDSSSSSIIYIFCLFILCIIVFVLLCTHFISGV